MGYEASANPGSMLWHIISAARLHRPKMLVTTEGEGDGSGS